MEDLLKAIDAEKQCRFTKSWSKLERGTKLNRLNDFIESEKEKNELNDDEHGNLPVSYTHLTLPTTPYV